MVAALQRILRRLLPPLLHRSLRVGVRRRSAVAGRLLRSIFTSDYQLLNFISPDSNTQVRGVNVIWWQLGVSFCHRSYMLSIDLKWTSGIHEVAGQSGIMLDLYALT